MLNVLQLVLLIKKPYSFPFCSSDKAIELAAPAEALDHITSW